MERYKELLQALKVLHTAILAVDREDGSCITPHWRMLRHASEYLRAQAEAELHQGA